MRSNALCKWFLLAAFSGMFFHLFLIAEEKTSKNPMKKMASENSSLRQSDNKSLPALPTDKTAVKGPINNSKTKEVADKQSAKVIPEALLKGVGYSKELFEIWRLVIPVTSYDVFKCDILMAQSAEELYLSFKTITSPNKLSDSDHRIDCQLRRHLASLALYATRVGFLTNDNEFLLDRSRTLQLLAWIPSIKINWEGEYGLSNKNYYMWSDLEAWPELYWGCGNTGGSGGGSCGCSSGGCGCCYYPGMPDGLVAIAGIQRPYADFGNGFFPGDGNNTTNNASNPNSPTPPVAVPETSLVALLAALSTLSIYLAQKRRRKNTNT